MTPGGKQPRQRASWWAASDTSEPRVSWLGSVRNKLARKQQDSTADSHFGVRQDRKKKA